MKARLSLRGLLAALLLIAAGPSLAYEEGAIVGVLARPAALYDGPSTKAKVVGEWPANQNFADNPRPIHAMQDSFAQVDHDGRKVWVMLRAVKADRKIRIAEACGAMPTDSVPRSAATRGVGERCK